MKHANTLDHKMAAIVRADLDRLHYPEIYHISSVMYESVERVVLDWLNEMDMTHPFEEHTLKLGPHGGIMFKNVELIRTTEF